MAALTVTETKLALLVGRGLDRFQMAAQLGLSPNTVAKYLVRARGKVGATNAAHLAVMVALAQQKQRAASEANSNCPGPK